MSLNLNESELGLLERLLKDEKNKNKNYDAPLKQLCSDLIFKLNKYEIVDRHQKSLLEMLEDLENSEITMKDFDANIVWRILNHLKNIGIIENLHNLSLQGIKDN